MMYLYTFLGPPHGISPAAVLANKKNKQKSFKSSEHIYEKRDEPTRGFGYLSLFSDPLDLSNFYNFQQGSRFKDYHNPNRTKCCLQTH